MSRSRPPTSVLDRVAQYLPTPGITARVLGSTAESPSQTTREYPRPPADIPYDIALFSPTGEAHTPPCPHFLDSSLEDVPENVSSIATAYEQVDDYSTRAGSVEAALEQLRVDHHSKQTTPSNAPSRCSVDVGDVLVPYSKAGLDTLAYRVTQDGLESLEYRYRDLLGEIAPGVAGGATETVEGSRAEPARKISL